MFRSRQSPITPLPWLLHGSVIAVWLLTALVSVWNKGGISAQLLAEGGVQSPTWQAWLIWGGAAWDLGVGLCLWRWPSRGSYGLAFAGVLVMTVLASGLLPALWWHPLGPLSKNLPILAILWWGMTAPPQQARIHQRALTSAHRS